MCLDKKRQKQIQELQDTMGMGVKFIILCLIAKELFDE